ncbi:hypothetical protein [Aquimarina agarilytica]|uniref:hypothetical protein n=1 Tax=Aquimarina agarilytica TaxID=1087449 RepID=UPI000287C16B|nr:hypothetical protein [Aquimarina agarilytica]
MKSLFTYLSIILLLTTSCKYDKKPTFINVEKINIQNINKGSVTFKADAIFKNNNDFGGNLVTENIEVFANSISIGHLQTEEFNIPTQDTFAIPLTGKFSIDKILAKDKNDIINNVLNILSSKKIPISFKGDVLFKKGPFKYTYHIDQTNEVKIKL